MVERGEEVDRFLVWDLSPSDLSALFLKHEDDDTFPVAGLKCAWNSALGKAIDEIAFEVGLRTIGQMMVYADNRGIDLVQLAYVLDRCCHPSYGPRVIWSKLQIDTWKKGLVK